MKVLILHEDTRVPGQGGGAESLLRDQTEALRRLGHEVAWLHTPQIARAVDEFQPDVVQVSTIHNFLGLEPARWLQASRVPHVWALMDYWPFCHGRMLLKNWMQGEDCPAIRGVCDGRCDKGPSLPEWRATVNGSPTATYNEHTAAIFRRNGVRLDYVVELGVDTALFRPEPSARTAEPGVWASSAWPEYPVKGMPVLARAMRGTGRTANLLAHVTREQVAAGLQRGSVYVFPSIYQETWGLCLTEAMACGLACVASDVAGARAQAHGGECALLVPPRDADWLREAILGLLADERARRELGERARAHVEQEHSLEAMGRRWEAVYESVTRSGLKPAPVEGTSGGGV